MTEFCSTNYTRTQKLRYDFFQEDKPLDVITRHLGAFYTMPDKTKTDTSNYYYSVRFQSKFKDSSFLKSPFQIIGNGFCAQLFKFKIENISGIVTITDKCKKSTTIILDSILTDFSIDIDKVILTIDLSQYPKTQEVYFNIDSHSTMLSKEELQDILKSACKCKIMYATKNIIYESYGACGDGCAGNVCSTTYPYPPL